MENDKYIGRLLDNRYEILEVIGSGGMAVVYKARCHRLNRLVAVKILKEDNLEDEDFRRRFHAESQAVAMLSHPNIVSIYDVSTSVMADYIVMELCEGITLKQYMEKKGILNWKETLHFAMQIAKALEHAHSKGIVHRDIKPHNVMVLKNGSVKVMDFGIARLISRGNTLTKEALGSVHYISPEQARGGRVDDRSDIYSLGVVMYEMMAGRPPYDGDSPVSVAIQHINGGAKLPSMLNPNIPGGLEQIIMKAMAHNVSNRYPSATRMLADMDEFRKEPAVLFDYTGLPIDAATRMQNSSVSMQPLKNTVDKPEQMQTPSRPSRPATPPNERYRQTPPNEQRRREPPRGSGKNNSRRHSASQSDNKRSRITLIAIIACSLVAVVAIGIILWLFLGGGLKPKEEFVSVPNLVGETYAKDRTFDGLTIHVKSEYSDTVDKNVIIRQEPAAGQSVKKPSDVIVYVSKGKEIKTVDLKELKNNAEAEAVKELKRLELNYEIKSEYNNSFKKGIVFKTEPAAGNIRADQKVIVYVSLGAKKTIPMFELLENESEESLRKRLEDQQMGLDIKTEKEPNKTIKAGTVLRTKPSAGERLESGDKVILYVSSGIPTAVIPDLSNKTEAEALKIIKDLGFTTEVKITPVPSDQAKGTVVGQSPEKDVAHEVTAEIELQVSDGSMVPIEKVVYINVEQYAKPNGCHVEVRKGGEVLLSTELPADLPQGAKCVILYNQKAYGIVKYTVIINHGQVTFEVEESFVNEESNDNTETGTENGTGNGTENETNNQTNNP